MFMVRWFCLMLLLGVWLNISESVTPDDEDYTAGAIFDTFLSNLEYHTGFGKNYIVSAACPDYQSCTIKYDGDIVWEIREKLYSDNMKASFSDDNDNQNITLDGCLDAHENNIEGYRSCMETVRDRMNLFLNETFDNLFKEKLEENNCNLAKANCL